MGVSALIKQTVLMMFSYNKYHIRSLESFLQNNNETHDVKQVALKLNKKQNQITTSSIENITK